MTPHDLLLIDAGDEIAKSALYALIVGSKQPGSECWGGPDVRVGNTPMQGINWIGPPDAIKAVIVRSKMGRYDDDGWQGGNGDRFDYAFKARNDRINLSETANRCLIDQPAAGYPVLLLIERGESWLCEGRFDVETISATHVTLQRTTATKKEAVRQSRTPGGRTALR